jgi:hypothetical protein
MFRNSYGLLSLTAQSGRCYNDSVGAAQRIRHGFPVTTKKWRLLVTPLTGTMPLHQLEVEAPNWMGALREGRKAIGEDGGLPAGASCAVAPDGTVTILDSEARRKFLLMPGPLAALAPPPAPAPIGPVVPGNGQTKARAETRRVFQTMSFEAARVPASAAARSDLELLFTRDEAPSAENPLVYRERAFLIPKGMSVNDAEAALRHELAELQRLLGAMPRGKLVNLAAFDHRWMAQPERPPLVAIEWRDWRGEAAVDYPATEQAASGAGSQRHAGEPDDRLASVFEALHELALLKTPAEGLEFIVNLLDTTVPCAAISACLYDINTDELRFVAATGPGANTRRGTAIKRGQGLFGLASRSESHALIVRNIADEPAYEPAVDGRQGLDVQNVLVRQVIHDGRLLGVLQLINRRTGSFSAPDVHLVNYSADRLSEFLRDARARARH